MIVNKKVVDDINVELNGSTFVIRYPDVSYSFWKMRIPYDGDYELSTILMNLLVCLDCTITFSGKRLLFVGQMMYDYHVSEYYYYILHMEDKELYNYYLDLLIDRHIENIKFEQDNPIIITQPKVKTKAVRKGKVENIFIRQVTTNMFTNSEAYIYSNAKTGETINSDDPNLLDSLNAKPVKEKRTRVVGVSMDAMTFSFKKKE